MKNKQTLIYENRKQPPMTWDISTPEKRWAAFLELFNHLKDDWQVYTLNYWGGSHQAKTQKILYHQACAGDGEAAEQLLRLRKSYEYEGFTIV